MKNLLIPAFFALAMGLANAQPVLVKDINTRPADMFPANYTISSFYSSSDHVFFLKDPLLNNSAWWVTDGTPDGTHAIDDPPGDLNISAVGVFNNEFYYGSVDGAHAWLMKYTVATSTSQVVKEFETGDDMYMIRADNQLIFARISANSTELWKSDGTTAGTVKFRTITPMQRVILSADGGDSYTYFVGQTSDYSHRLWRTDGTDAGTIMLKSSGPEFDDYYWSMTAIGNDLYFNNEDNGVEPAAFWKSDGTVEGTKKVSPLGQVRRFTTQKLGDKILFGASGRLYASDGTLAGTEILLYNTVEWATIHNGLYYFVGYDYNNSERFLGKSDGTVAGTSIMIILGKEHILSGVPWQHLGDKLLVQVETPSRGFELGITDGTVEGTVLLKDINKGTAGSGVQGFYPLGNKMLFVADDGTHGRELWLSDGTAAGTTFVKDTNPGTADGVDWSSDLISSVAGNQYVFGAWDTLGSQDLWITDGTEVNTKKVYDCQNGLGYLGSIEGMPVYFVDSKKIIKVKADGTAETVKEFQEYFSGHLPGNKSLEADGKIYFSGYSFEAGQELWVSDGTEEGTHLTKDIIAGQNSSQPGESITAAGKVYFVAFDPINGRELWVSDGTEAGTVRLSEIEPGNTTSFPFYPQVMNDKAYFFVEHNGLHTKQLWTTDGTPEGTYMIKDLQLSTDGNIPGATVIGDRIIFSFNQKDLPRQLWNSDGTAEGTTIIKSFSMNNGFNYIGGPLAGNGQSYFYIDDGEHGGEPWSTDGTEAGTKVMDLTPGPSPTYLGSMQAIHGLLYFYSGSNALLRSAGTAELTEQVLDNAPAFYRMVGETLYFAISTDELGFELYTMPFAKMEQQILFEDIADKTIGDDDFKLSASATSGLPVTFEASPSDRVSVTGSVVKILKTGSVTITASQAGNESIAEAVASQTICFRPTKPAITLKEDKGTSKILQSSTAEGNQWYLNGNKIDDATGATFEAEEDGNYTVTYSVDGCESEASIVMPVAVVGLEEEFAGAVFPNPAKDKLYIQWNGSAVNASVIDVKGTARLNTSFVNNTEVHIADLPAGFYVLKLVAGDKQMIRKFIKE